MNSALLTQEQNMLLTHLETYCHSNNTNVWVGTWNDLLKIGGNRDLLNQLEQRSYIASYMQIGDHWTVMPTRAKGMECDAMRAQYEEE